MKGIDCDVVVDDVLDEEVEGSDYSMRYVAFLPFVASIVFSETDRVDSKETESVYSTGLENCMKRVSVPF